MVKARILVVEDESIVALSIQNRLEALGYGVIANVTSGEAAIQQTAENLPDLVLMDIRLTGRIDGIEAAAQIRNRFHIPVVYLTAYTDEETINRAKLTEPYGYILKPFEPRDLGTAIEIALYKHQMERQRGEREQWLSTTLQSMGDAVITTDSQGLVTYMNPVAEALTGWKQEEALGCDVNQVFRTINEKTRQVVKNPLDVALLEGITVVLENHTLLITKDGSEIPIDDSAAPIKNQNGEIRGAVLVFHEIIERHKLAELLQKTNEELEVRVAESAAQLKQLNEQLQTEIPRRQRLEEELRFIKEKEEELEELKSRLFASISHEYRTPLTTILSSTQLLERYSSQWIEEKKKKHFQRIQTSVEYLTKLVNNVTFLDQAEAGIIDFEPAPIDIESVARELVEEWRASVTNKHVIILECQGCLSNPSLDEKLLKLILKNLFTNAVNFSPQGGQVCLEVQVRQGESEQDGNREIVFCVSDQGIGIPNADLTQVFKAFFRSSNVGVTPGAGLGLTIVQEATRLHGGKILVGSELGKGTSVTLILPWQEEPAICAKGLES
ncbi:ATP-binding protein [Lyngbya aestuarii]|uniref:ATP-binding protein n=1 Tax=Lyngbya aestuarii TaxID=118322 RepID=UPI00403E3341